MNRFNLRVSLVALAVGILFAAPACANPLSFDISNSSTIFWNSLRITTDPGVTINWLPPQFSAIFGAAVNGNSSNYPGVNQSGPNPLVLNEQIGGLNVSLESSNNRLSSDLVWANSPSGFVTTIADRYQFFQVTGSGLITFAVDYSLSLNRMITSLPTGWEPNLTSSAELDFLSTNGIKSRQHQSISLPVVVGPVNDSKSQTGTLTVQYQVSDGQTYRIFGEVYTASFVSAPEPSSLILLCIGLAGVIKLELRYSGRV